MATESNIDENQRLKNHGLIFYDGECGFCQFWIQFLLKRDYKNYFLFAPLQGKLALKYIEKSRIPVISKIERVSRPGLRVYSNSKELPKVLNNLGIAIISTSQGVMTNLTARELGIGGEILCYIW